MNHLSADFPIDCSIDSMLPSKLIQFIAAVIQTETRPVRDEINPFDRVDSDKWLIPALNESTFKADFCCRFSPIRSVPIIRVVAISF